MKLINYIKKLDRTKRYVILFVLISFISIFSIGIYNSASTSKKYPQVETVSVVNKSKKKDSKNKKTKEKSVKKNDVSNTTNEVKNENNTNETNTNVNNGENKQESSQKNTSSSKKSNNTSSQNNNTPVVENNNNNNNQVTQNPESPKKYINIQVKGVNSTWISKQINFDNSITAYDALKIACRDIGKEVHEKNSSYGGVYIEGIGDLYERDYGGTSGWKYKVNGTCPSVACSSYTLKEGDTLVWYYAMSMYE